MSQEIKHWKQLNKSLLHKTKVFDLYVQRLRSPHNEYEDDFYFIEVVDWVNVIALTEEQEVVLINQYRFGIRDNSLEIPGGMVDDPSEDPKNAALRELTEETGYVAENIELIGSVHPNPAIQRNRIHSYLATGVRLESSQDLDPAEHITVELAPLEKIPQLIASGRISHSLVVCAFYSFLMKQHPDKMLSLLRNACP